MAARLRTTCRVCGSSSLAPMLDLGDQYLQGAFLKPGRPAPSMERFPTRLVRCDPSRVAGACGLVQLSHTLPSGMLYEQYWYRSGTNRTMRDHLAGVVKGALAALGRTPRQILDIGCNDGTLLRAYPDEVERWGVDPSDIADGIEAPIRVVNDFFPSQQLVDEVGDGRFDIITTIAMFYDLEDPVGFARAVRRLLAADGVWVVEMSYLPLMLARNSYDTVCHEHLEYYSLAVLERIAERAGLAAFRAEINGINGGSLRLYLEPVEGGRRDGPVAADPGILHDLRREEIDLALETDAPYAAFAEQVHRVREELREVLAARRAAGRPIHVYGASTKGNVILQWCGLDQSWIDCAADRNPEKHGARTLGTGIPIVSEEESREATPDYLVLPWHFRAEFLERERDAILRGSAMIFPLPEVAVVTAANLEEEIARAHLFDSLALK